jgi:hypothetical protein
MALLAESICSDSITVREIAEVIGAPRRAGGNVDDNHS